MVKACGVWTVCVASLLAAAVLTTSARPHQEQQPVATSLFGKRDEAALPVRSAGQVWGGRYGRSGGHSQVTLRNDRFFLGSRYGKRSGSPFEEGSDDEEGDAPLTCLYTGVNNLYRCFDRKDNTSEDFPSPRK